MKLIRTLCLVFSMYSRIPMPILEYTQEDMRYTFLAFPLVGVVDCGSGIWYSDLWQDRNRNVPCMP